jgi:hypothetical protein
MEGWCGNRPIEKSRWKELLLLLENMIFINMRDGIYSFFVISDGTASKGIAVIEHDAIRGFNASHLYSVERLVNYPNERASHLGKHWRAKAVGNSAAQRGCLRGFPAMVGGEEDEDQFWFEGESDTESGVSVEIQGAWLHDLPWHRVA